MTNNPPEPDLAILIAAAWRGVTDELQATMADAELAMRPSFGFVIRAVAAEDPTINRLAGLLDVSKQAASQLADEVERAGFIERYEDPADRRRRRLRLTESGRRVRELALATSERLERELIDDVGAEAASAFRAALIALITRSGALEDVLARRARPVW